MKIYTKVGDGGQTRLFSGVSVRKNAPRVIALGDVDELNALLGWIGTQLKKNPFFRLILSFQNDLFILGADLASLEKKKGYPRIEQKHIRRLEKTIDHLEKKLPRLTSFILPGGSSTGALLHLARAVCRRAERSVTTLLDNQQTSAWTQIYLNRLSDALFVLARFANNTQKTPETPWIFSKKSR